MRLFVLCIFLVGCASDPALDLIETTSAKLQPGYDALKEVCPVVKDLAAVIEAANVACSVTDISTNIVLKEICPTVYKYAGNAEQIQETAIDGCRIADDAFKAAQTILEAAAIAAGGEPCLENCSNSSTE